MVGGVSTAAAIVSGAATVASVLIYNARKAYEAWVWSRAEPRIVVLLGGEDAVRLPSDQRPAA